MTQKTPGHNLQRENSRSVAELLKLGAAYNPRKISAHDLGALRLSIAKFGAVEPIVLNIRTNRIVGGHQRLKAADAEGLESFPVVEVDLDETEERQLNIALNRIAGEWDEDRLIQVLEEIENAGGDLALTGFDDDELAELLGALEDDESEAGSGEGDPDEMPENVSSRCSPGDLWKLGPHRLLCGDCREPKDVARLLGGRRINLAFTSPPYASQRKYDEESGFKPIPPDEYVEWFDAVQKIVASHLAKDGSWFVNIKEHAIDGERVLYVKDLTLAHAREWGWRFVDELCWQRPGMTGGYPNRFKNAWEPIFHFSKSPSIKFRSQSVLLDTVPSKSARTCDEVGGAIFDSGPDGMVGGTVKSKNFDGALPSNVLRISGVEQGVSHTAAFPVGLPEFFIKAFSDEGDSVYDPFMGSGTTIIAAEKNRRHGYGIEISPKYCDIILARWEEFTGVKAELDE